MKQELQYYGVDLEPGGNLANLVLYVQYSLCDTS